MTFENSWSPLIISEVVKVLATLVCLKIGTFVLTPNKPYLKRDFYDSVEQDFYEINIGTIESAGEISEISFHFMRFML